MIESQKNYLGLDWGEKRIGLALADGEIKIAMPFLTVSSLKEIIEIIATEKINCLIIGNPQKMNGDKANNPNYLNFLKNLKNQINIEIVEVDERLSSKSADVLGFGNKDMASRDEGAATIILQSYLDALT